MMRIIEYTDFNNITVQFQDDYKLIVHTRYDNFLQGCVKNNFYPSVYGVGIVGNKYPISKNKKATKEYKIWNHMLERCFSQKTKERRPTYKDVTCCKEWLYYPNFYEWLHGQENFEKWYNGSRWALDKDIIKKNNKVYSPSTCCVIPTNINTLFVKNNAVRGLLSIGVHKEGDKYSSQCFNPFTHKIEHLGNYQTEEEAFTAYKVCKEAFIKQVAQKEYDKGNITKQCYEAMMNYNVEITD